MQPIEPSHDEDSLETETERLRALVKFAEELERQPLPHLLRSLPKIASISNQRLDLAEQVFQRRLDRLSPKERIHLRELGRELEEDVDRIMARRLRSLLAERPAARDE